MDETTPRRTLVTFQPWQTTVEVACGTTLLEAAEEAGVPLEVPCGGEGLCGKCRLRLVAAPPPSAADRQRLSPRELNQGIRLACQTPIHGPLVVEVPAEIRRPAGHQILAHSAAGLPSVIAPSVEKCFVELPSPRRGDDAPDAVRIQRATRKAIGDLGLLRELSGRLREAEFRGTIVSIDGRIIDFEPGDSTRQSYAVAVDLGTTTLAAALVDLSQGIPHGVAARVNPQTRIGDDVLSRILYAREHPGGLAELREGAVGAINEMIGQLTAFAGVDPQRIYEVVVAGNTTMQQLLCGIDPRSLGELPFVPVLGATLQVRAADLGLAIHPRGHAVVLPVIGGFVGGDTIAGMVAMELGTAVEPTLFIDIGTNGEIVLAAGGRLWAASTAAGPAFEGARISQGMRGSEGAVERVVIDDDVRLQVIGHTAPVGICGSGLIDLGAELLRQGLMSTTGKLARPAEISDPRLAARLVRQDAQDVFLLADGTQTGNGRPLAITQRDLRELQLATGAIRAGVEILLKRAGLRVTDLGAVLVAGAFGNYIRRSNAQRIGLLPHAVPPERIAFCGNTSLAGAEWVALSRTARDQLDDLARRTEHVDLGTDREFQAAFAEAMIFPEDGD